VQTDDDIFSENTTFQQANRFYTSKEEELRVVIDELERDLRSADPSREQAAREKLVTEICPELGSLREYVVLNYTAVVKAVKKSNKNLGQNIHAVQLLAGEPIFCSLGLAKLVTRAEMLTMHAAPESERKIDDFCCPICDEVLSNPVILPCKHRFCFKCIAAATFDDSSLTASLAESTTFMESAMRQVADPTTRAAESSLHSANNIRPPVRGRGSKCTLVRGACPVCKKPHINDESGLRVDPKLDDFIRTHFFDKNSDRAPGAFPAPDSTANSDSVPSTDKLSPLENDSSSNPRRNIPKALIIVVAGCRSDTMLAAHTPLLSSFVKGRGCFSFHMQHTSNSCGNTSSDAIIPLLTGSEGAALSTALHEKHRDGLCSQHARTVFSRLTEVRSWLHIAVAIGGATDLSSAFSSDSSTENLTPFDASDVDAANASITALKADSGADVIYLHLNDVQHAGMLHGYGPHITGYREAVEATDANLERVMQALHARQLDRPHEDWLIIIASPAGGTTRADMPAVMQGHFDAADWCGGGGRQLRAAGVSGFESLPQHATGWVLVDAAKSLRFRGGGANGRACGEILPPPCDVDIAPTVLEHFGIAPRREWGLDGAHLLASRRIDVSFSQASHSELDADDAAPSSGHNIAEASSTSSATASSAESVVKDNGNVTKDHSTGKYFSTVSMHDSSGNEIVPSLQNCPSGIKSVIQSRKVAGGSKSPRLSVPGPFASHLPGLFEPTGCAVVGHRGFGMNRCPGKGIRENTIASFVAAHGSGAGWCEFDVQVTADGVPVLWHDDVLLVRHGFGPVQSFSIRELDLSELKALSRAAVATAASAAAGVPMAVAAIAGEACTRITDGAVSNDDDGEPDEEDEEDEETDSPPEVPVVFYRKFPVGFGSRLAPEPEPWVMNVEDEIPTLHELMIHAPSELGFSMELKFDEANPCDTPRLVAELRSILAVCRRHPSRRIMFSSFDPDAALLMRALQGLYPVMMISDCKPHHSDPRRSSVAAAKKCALEGGLCGLVLDIEVLSKRPEVADEVRSCGLLLGTYGTDNDDKPLASKQVEWGMCLVCTDNVATLTGMFNSSLVDQGNSTPARAPLMSPSLNAAAAARRLGEMELEAVLRAPWYQLSEDGKKPRARRHMNNIPTSGVIDRGVPPFDVERGRIGAAQALSALATEAAAGFSAVASAAIAHTSAQDSKSSDSSIVTGRKSGAWSYAPRQTAGVTSIGYWASFPRHTIRKADA